ncbi:MAG: hypothetical protein Q9186_003347 [Xanthomendoza sp. 1 TL-2023]
MKRLSKRLIAYLLLAALLVFWAPRAFPTRDQVRQQTAKSGAEQHKNKDASRYSHQVEDFPAARKVNPGNTDRKQEVVVGVAGGKLDLAAKTDNLLAQWIAREQEVKSSESATSSKDDDDQTGEGSERVVQSTAASERVTRHSAHLHTLGH